MLFFDGDWMTVFYYTSRKKTADWICWADFIFTLNAMDSSSFWWRGWELSTNLGILLYVYVYIYISWPSIAAEFVGIHDLNPGLSLTNWGFCPPNVTPLRKWASWSGLMNHPFPLIRLASLSLGAFCSRKLYALRCLGHHFPRWGNMRKNPPTTCVHGWIFDQFLLEIFLEGWHCSKTSRNIHSWNCHVKEDLFQGWCFFDWVSKFKFQEKFSGCTFWYVFVHLSWDPKKVFQRSRTV